MKIAVYTVQFVVLFMSGNLLGKKKHHHNQQVAYDPCSENISKNMYPFYLFIYQYYYIALLLDYRTSLTILSEIYFICSLQLVEL